jgi:branched-chain amino acid transport system permease protein
MIDPVVLSFVDALGQFLDPGNLLRVLVDGLAKSALYVMIAGGLTLIFGLMGVLNFAHGSLTMIGAYLGGLVMVVLAAHTAGLARVGAFFLAAAVVFLALSALGGALEVGLIRPLYDRPPLSQILLTFGVTLVLDELARIVVLFYGLQPISDWQAALATKPAVLTTSVPVGVAAVFAPVVGALAAVAAWLALARIDAARTVRERARDAAWLDAVGVAPEHAPAVVAGVVGAAVGIAVAVAVPAETVRVGGLSMFEIAMGALTVATLWAFLTRTRYGLVVRAGSEDDEMTAALGIDVRRVFTVVFALGAGVAGVAGVLLAWDSTWGASVPLAAETLLPAFVVVIIGGLGTFRGTVVAAVVVGMVDATMTWWFQNAIDFTGLPQMTIFLILVVVLVVRPQGLFGVAEVGGH